MSEQIFTPPVSTFERNQALKRRIIRLETALVVCVVAAVLGWSAAIAMVCIIH